jgi:hypothetical protein
MNRSGSVHEVAGLDDHEARVRQGLHQLAGGHAGTRQENGPMDDEVEVSAMAINVSVPEHLQWTDERRGEEFLLTTLNVRMLPDGTLAAKAYGRPTAGGRGAYTSFRLPDSPELRALVDAAATQAAAKWSTHRGLA